MKLDANRIEFLLAFYKRLSDRSWMLDLCSALGRHPILENIPNRGVGYSLFQDGEDHQIGDVVVIHSVKGENKDVTEVCYVKEKDPTILRNGKPTWQAKPFANFEDYKERPLFDAIDTFELPKGFMCNSTKIVTTFGRFLFNWIVWYRHPGVDLEFINEQQKAGSLGGMIAKMLITKKITADTGKRIINSVFYIASFDALFVPTLTEKSLMNSPEVMKRKEELLKEYGDKLTDPLVAKKFEQELIAMDKKWLEGDKSLRFLNALAAKTYEIHRKKLFIGIGGIPAFDQGSNAYTFIPNSLSQGWTKDAFPDICNEIRKGAYDRGKETAKGGEQTKFLLRVFQDVRITEDDCGSHMGIPMQFTEANVKDYFGQYIITGEKGVVKLTSETAPQFFGKTVLMRSPMFCHTKVGRCKICCGDMFNELDMKAIGMTVLKVGSRFTTLSMKNMHGTVITTQKVDPFDYVIQN